MGDVEIASLQRPGPLGQALRQITKHHMRAVATKAEHSAGNASAVRQQGELASACLEPTAEQIGRLSGAQSLGE